MTAAAPSPAPRRRAWAVAAAMAALLVIAFGVCEALGWPFLATPLQRALGDALKRDVRLGDDSPARPTATIHLFGGIDITADAIRIAAPRWSREPHMLLARGARLRLGYVDLWRASRGEPLRIRLLRAAQLDGHIERLADGRASWQFGRTSDVPDTSETPTRMPVFGRLQVDAGTMSYRDALTSIELDGQYSLADASNVSAAGVLPSGRATGLRFTATGTYAKQPVRIDLATRGVLPVIAQDEGAAPLPVTLEARVGGAAVSFHGTATDALHLGGLAGRFSVQGPSLAAAGRPLGVTLPTTGPFRAQGLVVKKGDVWQAVVENATIGSSRLAGAFTYDPRTVRPLLAGRLTGPQLLLADLGPAVGGTGTKAASRPPGAASSPRDAARVIPDREFDLPSLRAMDANVLVDIDSLDLGSSFLEPLRPLRAHLVLVDGVLTLRDLEARTGQGRLYGAVQLDGRAAQAQWTADLRWNGVRLESWIHQARKDAAPPWASGLLIGQARVAGQGRSTAAILGSLRGGIRMQLIDGAISHLAVEAAGLDIAQGLGVMLKGDDALPVTCSVVDLVAEQGQIKPRVLVLDTRDSTLWVEGSLSLATETMDLRVLTAPKDFSPLSLRTPLHLRGAFASPSVSLEKGKLATRVGASVLLGLLNPLAAVIPLMDSGVGDDAKRGGDACRALSKRIAAQPALPAPAAAPRK